MAKTVVAIFDSHSQAEDAAYIIKEKGLRDVDISIITKQTEDSNFENKRGRNDDIDDGVLTGGVLGGLGGLAIGVGSLVVPGLGIIAAAGPIVGILGGAVAGGVVGGLIDLGIPEDESRRYEKEIKEGRVIFSMKCSSEHEDDIKGILENCGAKEVKSH
jgi:uncharacterized membrane protein